MSEKDWRQPYYDMIDSVEQFSDNSWELEFCSSLRNRLDRNQKLTDKQLEKLEEIYEDYQ